MTPRILIAEDDDLQSSVLRAALEHRRYEVEIVRDGVQAVSRLRTGFFHIGLLDYHMPAMNGLLAAREVQGLFREVNRPRLIAFTVSANGLREREATLGGLTFDAVVPKARGLPALFAAIEASLRRVDGWNPSAAAKQAVGSLEWAAKAVRRVLSAGGPGSSS
jgi:CheY-like chemotaxis protein